MQRGLAWRYGILAAFGIALCWTPVLAQDRDPVKVEVGGVGRSPLTRSPAVLLHAVDEERILPIFIGDAEAAAIMRYRNRQITPRPMTHDLIGNLLTALDGRLERVTVNDFQDNTFYARLHIRTGERMVIIDARPSDAIALALKHNAPITVARTVMDLLSQPYPDAGETPPPETAPSGEPAGLDRAILI